MTIARTRRGVSLVEVMVTLLVLGAGLVGLARLQTALSASASTSMQRTEASMLAQKKVESYRGFISPAAYDAYFASGTTVTGSETVTGQNASYTVQWTVSDVASASQGRYANIGVTVAWNDAKGEAHVARLQSSFARVPRPVNLAPPASGTSPPASCPGDAAASWTVGTTTCQGVINPGGGPGDTRLVSSTTGTGTNQYVCTADGT